MFLCVLCDFPNSLVSGLLRCAVVSIDRPWNFISHMRCALMSYLSIDWLRVLSSAYGSTARQIEPAEFMLGLPFRVYMSVFHTLMYHCCYFRATRQTVPNIWLPTSAIWNWVSSAHVIIWGGAWRAYVWGNLYLMFVGYNEFTLHPNAARSTTGYHLSFSLNVTVWEIFTFGVVAISMSCYCFIVLSLSLFIVDK